MKEFLFILLALFLLFETINWFTMTTKLLKYTFQKEPLTEEQAKGIHKHIKLIYFWLSSPYYFNKLRKAYFLVYESPTVKPETKIALRKSLTRRFVHNLPKVYQ